MIPTVKYHYTSTRMAKTKTKNTDNVRDFSGSPVVKTSRFHYGVEVQFLVGELSSP